MTTRSAGRSRVTRAARAAKYEMIYRALGETRSVRGVWELARASGDTISNNALERYSADYGWVARAQAFDEERAQTAAGAVLGNAVADTVRHAEFGRAMQDLAQVAIKNRMKTPEEIELTGSEIARLGDVGIRIERLASGMATERIEVMGSAFRILTEQIGPLVVRHTERIIETIEQYVRPGDAGLANLIATRIDDSLASFASDADRVIDASFRAYGLLAEQAIVSDEDGDR